MTLELRVRPEAENDLADAAEWYEKQQARLGHQFLDEARTSFSAITENPLLFPIVHRNTRRALMRRFPFGIYYRIESTTLVIIAVMHGSRHPRRWKSRS